MQDFSKHYKSFTNIQLLEILNNPTDYLEDAVIAAKAEFESRQISEEDLASAVQFLDDKAEKKKSKKMSFGLKSVNYSIHPPDLLDSSLVEEQEVVDRPTLEKLILGVVGICLLQSAFGFYGLYRIYRIGVLSWYDSIVAMVSVVIILVMLIPTYMFLNESRKGWSILTVMYLGSMMVTVVELFWRVWSQLYYIGNLGTIGLYWESIAGIILGAMVLWALLHPIVLRHYAVNTSLKLKIIGWTVGVVGLYLLVKYYGIFSTMYF